MASFIVFGLGLAFFIQAERIKVLLNRKVKKLMRGFRLI